MAAGSDDTLEALLAQMSWARSLARDLVRDLDRADDLVQDLWVRALESPPRDARAPRAWISKVLRNRWHEEWRRERRKRETFQPVVETAAEAQSDALERLETVQRLGEIVRGLAEPYQSAVLLRYFEALPIEQVAARMRVGVESAQKRVERGREMIRERMTGGEEERWMRGLALLALPRSAPVGSVLLGAGAAAGLLVALVVPLLWLLFGDGAAPADGAIGNRAADAASAARRVPNAPGIVAPDDRLTRNPAPEAPSQPRSVLALDAVSGSPLAGVEILATVRDAEERILWRSSWTSGAQPATLPSFADGAVLGLRARATDTHCGYGQEQQHLLGEAQDERPLEVPLWPRRGTIRGTVTDVAGLPLDGVEIGAWYDRGWLTGDAPSLTAVSDAQGAFLIGNAFSAVAPLVLLSADGRWVTRDFYLAPADAFPDRDVRDVVLVVEPAAMATVRVLDEQERPVAGARITLRASDRPAPAPWLGFGDSAARPQIEAVTDAAGRTRSFARALADYQVQVRHPGLADAESLLRGDAAELLVHLSARRGLRVAVLDPDGAAAAGARVLARWFGGGCEATTGADGTATLQVAAPEGASVRLLSLPEAPDCAIGWSDAFVPGAGMPAMAVHLGRGAPLSFRLIGADGSAPAGLDRLRLKILDAPRMRTSGDGADADIFTLAREWSSGDVLPWTADGRLTLAHLPAGNWTVELADDAGPLASGVVEAGGEEAVLRVGEFHDARFALALQISGRAPDGAVLVACVNADDPSDAVFARLPGALVAGEAPRVRGLHAGAWLVYARDEERATGAQARALIRESQASAECALHFEARAGGILTLLDELDAPLAHAEIRLRAADGTMLPADAPYATVRADALGRAALRLLPLDGPLTVEARRSYSAEWEKLPLTIEPGEGAWHRRLPPR